MLRRSSVSRSRALLQRCIAVVGVAGIVFSGSVATSQALPHFSTTGPLTTSVPGPPPNIALSRFNLPVASINCPTLALTATPATWYAPQPTRGALGSIALNTTSPCTSSDGYTYTITASAVSQVPLKHNGTDFYFDLNNVVWLINRSDGLQLRFQPAPYIMKWKNSASPGLPYSQMWINNVSLGNSIASNNSNHGWTGIAYVGGWKVEQAGSLITALL